MSVSLGILAIAFVMIALAELRFPARPYARQRWPLNLALGLCNTLVLKLAAVIGPLGAALLAQKYHIGLFQQVHLHPIVTVIMVVVLMDLALYAQHRAMHRFAPLWRFHKLHHADTDFDITTGVRFHPGEALLSFFYKGAMVVLLGAPLQSVVVFELWLTLGSLIEHANIRLPQPIDTIMRRFWVTPAMHAVHHSAHGQDHNHNFGFALSVWDRLFGSYRVAASGARIGLPCLDPTRP
jgi:sterol desaturase/sphingolipid hydroxylase (fatty acid hydroxylase superfamily)